MFNLHFHILPSQFPNDYLSITDIKTSMHTPTVLRWGFSPHSLFTDYTLTRLVFYSIVVTLCDDIKFSLVHYTIFFYKNQYIKQLKICKKQTFTKYELIEMNNAFPAYIIDRNHCKCRCKRVSVVFESARAY